MWQNSQEQKERVKKQEEYWLDKLSEDLPVLNIPADYPRPANQSFEGASVSFKLTKEETENIKLLATENGLTLYMAVLSIFSILLSKLSGQEDMLVGTPIVGRNHIDLEKIVGMFVNTLVIRINVKGESPVAEFFKQIKQTTIEAFEHQEYPVEELVDKISKNRDTSRNPLFDVMFNMLNQTEYIVDISRNEDEEYIHTLGTSKFDLMLTLVDFGDQLMLGFEYSTKLFKPETINCFIELLKKIIQIFSHIPINQFKTLS